MSLWSIKGEISLKIWTSFQWFIKIWFPETAESLWHRYSLLNSPNGSRAHRGYSYTTYMTHTHIVLPEFPVQRQEVVRYLLKSSSNTHYVYISWCIGEKLEVNWGYSAELSLLIHFKGLVCSIFASNNGRFCYFSPLHFLKVVDSDETEVA